MMQVTRSQKRQTARPAVIGLLALAALSLGGLTRGLIAPPPDPGHSPLLIASRSLSALSVDSLNSALSAYIFHHETPAQAARRQVKLEEYLTDLGFRHLWQVSDGGQQYDAWYSAEADVTVLCSMQPGNSVSLDAYAVPGQLKKNEIAS